MEKKITVHCPLVPNFIKTDYEMISIADFTEDELREIGKEWTEELIKKSKQFKHIKEKQND